MGDMHVTQAGVLLAAPILISTRLGTELPTYYLPTRSPSLEG